MYLARERYGDFVDKPGGLAAWRFPGALALPLAYRQKLFVRQLPRVRARATGPAISSASPDSRRGQRTWEFAIGKRSSKSRDTLTLADFQLACPPNGSRYS